MFATIVALTNIGLAFFYIVEVVEALLIPWHVTHRIREEAGTMEPIHASNYRTVRCDFRDLEYQSSREEIQYAE